ncbi:hypothetical protein EVAR_39798_1 [Eumeta japonica]|uniref:Uncharacterized protein n=1 Tax=Eumeta variegata TaxID=151549 RepID=A0A4C1X2Y9_EUMVA|nr:hypothetical protein EVAR_39798_1 [Eumeta japonica]
MKKVLYYHTKGNVYRSAPTHAAALAGRGTASMWTYVCHNLFTPGSGEAQNKDYVFAVYVCTAIPMLPRTDFDELLVRCVRVAQVSLEGRADAGAPASGSSALGHPPRFYFPVRGRDGPRERSRPTDTLGRRSGSGGRRESDQPTMSKRLYRELGDSTSRKGYILRIEERCGAPGPDAQQALAQSFSNCSRLTSLSFFFVLRRKWKSSRTKDSLRAT